MPMLWLELCCKASGNKKLIICKRGDPNWKIWWRENSESPVISFQNDNVCGRMNINASYLWNGDTGKCKISFSSLCILLGKQHSVEWHSPRSCPLCFTHSWKKRNQEFPLSVTLQQPLPHLWQSLPTTLLLFITHFKPDTPHTALIAPVKAGRWVNLDQGSWKRGVILIFIITTHQVPAQGISEKERYFILKSFNWILESGFSVPLDSRRWLELMWVCVKTENSRTCNLALPVWILNAKKCQSLCWSP